MLAKQRKVEFLLSYGVPQYIGTFDVPERGQTQSVKVEFTTDGKDPLTDAFQALERQMGRQPYQVWQWWWRG